MTFLSSLTALHYAVQSNSPASIRAFVQLPELTHLPDNEGRTPLMTAALNAFDQIVKVRTLLGYGMHGQRMEALDELLSIACETNC